MGVRDKQRDLSSSSRGIFKYMERPDDCPICLDPLDVPGNPLVKPLKLCGHYMHPECLSKHHKQECPVCRRPQHDVKITGRLVVMQDTTSLSAIRDQLDSRYVVDAPHPFFELSRDVLDCPEEWAHNTRKKERYPEEQQEYEEQEGMSPQHLLRTGGWRDLLDDSSSEEIDYPDEDDGFIPSSRKQFFGWLEVD
jgi:hypothetical protein